MAASSPRCLIVEDQALIGMALEASLEEAGFTVAGPFSSTVDALAWLTENTPELALLDVLLKDGPCTRLVRELRGRGVPFAIYSGLKPPHMPPPELADVPWLEKPVAREALVKTLSQMQLRSREAEAR